MSERDLWQAVLMAQIEDAGSAPHIGNRNDKAERTAKARHYLTTPSKDLETVCSLAGADTDALIYRMKKRIADMPPVPVPDVAEVRRPKVRKHRSAMRIEHNGEALTVAEWSECLGLYPSTILTRIKKCLPVDEVLRPDDLRGAHMRVNQF